MPNTFNVYCDESCYLKNDMQKAMVLGALWCPRDKRKEISRRIREIKLKHRLPKNFEIKWTKVSQSKLSFYLDLVDYFFDNEDLHFRALVISDKTLLKHHYYSHDHDTWYYKMYFVMLKVIFDPNSCYKVYLDIKDTLGKNKIENLHKILCNNAHDFSKEIIEYIKLIHSYEVEQLQLADLLIGAVSYINRGLSASLAKTKLVERVKERSHYSLVHSTLPREGKMNILIWQAREFE